MNNKKVLKDYFNGVNIKNPKVTVLMSIYNGEKYLHQAINSILNQTFKDFEFLIINDGSTDGTAEILQSYNDFRIRIINNEKNIGLTKSLNKGLKLAKGDYIARMDADDISLPERFERQVEFLNKNKKMGLVGTFWYTIDENGQEIDISKPTNSIYAVHFMCHGTSMIRKRCLDKIGFYREVFEFAQDYDLWLRIADKYEIKNIKEPLYKLRIRDDSISLKKKTQQNLYASLAIKMAKERKKYGRDRLSIATEYEANKIRDQRLKASGIKKRKLLSYNYSIWSKAAFVSGEDEKSFYCAINAFTWYPLNYRIWNILIKAIFGKFKDNPIKLIFQCLNFLFIRVNNLRRRILQQLVSLNFLRTYKIWWNYLARDIDEKWGTIRHDYALLSRIISSSKPRRILDIGCGSGRLFPLYNDLKINEVVGIDISNKALKIANSRYSYSNIKTYNQHILDLNFPIHYFDLVISNRVLQHIPQNEIEIVIKKLTELGKRIYINEMYDSDHFGESFYLFKYDYILLFDKFGFQVIERGCLGKQTWFLFGKR